MPLEAAVKCSGPHSASLTEGNSFSFPPELEEQVFPGCDLRPVGLMCASCEIFVKSRHLEVHICHRYCITLGAELGVVVVNMHINMLL